MVYLIKCSYAANYELQIKETGVSYKHCKNWKYDTVYLYQIATVIIPHLILVWFQWQFGMNIICYNQYRLAILFQMHTIP